jgi:hypothetical protein
MDLLGTLSDFFAIGLIGVWLWYAIGEWQFRRRVSRCCDKSWLLEEDSLDDHSFDDPPFEPSTTNQTETLPTRSFDDAL